MVRSLSQWTKTLSFPNRHSKECNVNVHPIQAPPTPARNKSSGSLNSPSSSPPSSPQNVNVPITEISQIVSLIKKKIKFKSHYNLQNFRLNVSIYVHRDLKLNLDFFIIFPFGSMGFQHEKKNVEKKNRLIAAL